MMKTWDQKSALVSGHTTPISIAMTGPVAATCSQLEDVAPSY